ncbi:MAG: hypothetical protein KAR56_01720 [Thermoplasmata archaeon]|nr:hypothetical protein [Thermoplasmata archaeon]
MTSSYLKAMQLTKQLEEKVKEEKENRHLAENEVLKAEDIIKSAKVSDINVAKAEALLVNASNSIKGKDYVDAIGHATQAKDVAMQSYTDSVQSIIDSVDKLIEVGADSVEGIKLLEEAKNALANNDFEKAMTIAKESWSELESVAQAHLSETFSKAQSMIVLAKNVGEDVSASNDLLELARKSMESQSYFVALDQLNACMESVGSGLSSQVDELLDEAKSYMVTAKELDTDVDKVTELISRTEEEIQSSNLEDALSSARLSKSEAEKTLNRAISDNLEDQTLRIQEADKIGSDIDKANDILGIAKSALKGGNYLDSIEAIKELESEIYNAQFQRVLGTISLSRSKFIAANKIGADLTEAMEYLNNAKCALKEGTFATALEMALKGDAVVDTIVGEYEDIENTIASIEEQIKTAREMGAEVTNVGHSIISAKESLEARDFESVLAYVKQANEEVSSALYSFATECIEIAELVISAGDRLGANLKEPETMMKQAIDSIKSGNYPKSIELSGNSTKRAEEIIRIHVSNTIASAELAICDADNVDLNMIQGLLDNAKDEFDKNAFDRAFVHADRALNMLETSQSQKARDMVSNLNSAIVTASKMGCDIGGLENISSKCDEMLKIRDFSGTLADAEKALVDVKNQQYVAAERMFGEGKLAAIEAKKLGIDISDMKEGLKRAKTSFSKADLFSTYNESLAAKNLAENQIEYHQKAYDAINKVAAVLAEVKKNKVDVKDAMGILLSAKGMFERFEYENALNEAEKAKEVTEMIVNLYTAASKLDFVEESMGLLKLLEVDPGDLTGKVKELSNLIKGQDQANALLLAEVLENSARDVLAPSISKLISSTQSSIMDAKEQNLVVNSQEVRLDDSRKALDAKRYKEAVELANQVKVEIEEIRTLSQRAAMEIKVAQDVLNEGENLHADILGSKKLLETSLTELNGSNYKQAIDLAIRSSSESKKSIKTHVSNTIKAFKLSIEKAKLEGINVVAAEKLMSKATEAFNKKDYKSALSEAMKSEGELEKVGLQQEMAKKAITTAEKKLKVAEESGIVSKKAKSIIVQAREEMKDGNYVKALEQAIQSGDELHEVSEDFSEAKEAIQTLTALIESAKIIKADFAIAEKLLADAESAKDGYDYRIATEIAKEGAIEARRLSHSHLNSRLSKAYKLTDLAGKYGIDIAGSSSLLAESKTFLETGKFGVSSEKINISLNDAQGKIKVFFEDHYSQSERAMEHAKQVGADIETSQELLSKAKKTFDEGKFKEAIDLLEKSKDAIDLEKGFEREFIELTYEADRIISNSKKFGINVKVAQTLFDQAKNQKEKDYQMALATMKKTIDVVNNEIDAFRPQLVADIIVDKVQVGEWVDTDLIIKNKGKALAKDVKINIIGDISVESHIPIETLRGGGEITQKIKMKFETPGDVPVIIRMSSTRIMDGKVFEDEAGDHVFVMEAKAKTAKLSAESCFEQMKAAADTKCNICMGKAKAGVDIIKCSCGNEYHALCARRFGKCTGCGTEYTEKMDETASEDIIDDLDKPAAEEKKEETPKSVKKKVALKF